MAGTINLSGVCGCCTPSPCGGPQGDYTGPGPLYATISWNQDCPSGTYTLTYSSGAWRTSGYVTCPCAGTYGFILAAQYDASAQCWKISTNSPEVNFTYVNYTSSPFSLTTKHALYFNEGCSSGGSTALTISVVVTE